MDKLLYVIFLIFFISSYCSSQTIDYDDSLHDVHIHGEGNGKVIKTSHGIYIDGYIGKYPRIKPRNSAFAENPGSYEIVARVSKRKLFKNDIMTVDLFFTGYGIIENPKVFFMASDSIFSDQSLFTHSLLMHQYIYYWGARTEYVDHDDFGIMQLTGPPFLEANPSMFVDRDTINNDSTKLNWLLTEQYIKGTPPVQFVLHTKDYDDEIAGDYDFRFYFTYFNGKEWKTSHEIVQLHLDSRFEHYQPQIILASTIASILALISIIPTTRKGMGNAVRYIFNIAKALYYYLKSFQPRSKKVSITKKPSIKKGITK